MAGNRTGTALTKTQRNGSGNWPAASSERGAAGALGGTGKERAMAKTNGKLVDPHGDEVVHLHQDVLDADLTASEKVMMAVLRKRAFTTGRITVHYPEIAGLARMPLSTVKNKGGVLERLRKKGWIRGVVKDGACINVRMSPGWTSKSGEPSDFDGGTGTEPVQPDPEKGGTESVPASTESVPGAVLNRYRGGTESVPPSENEEGVKGVQNKDKSEAPVALTGSGPQRPGASLNLKEETACGAGAPVATPSLPPEVEQALRAEAEAWTMQVAETVNRNLVQGRDLRLKQPEGNDPIRVVSMKAEGSKPWRGDVETVYAYAGAWYPDADPVLAFRSVIREPARYRAVRQHIFGHAIRMQASQGYKRPRIKLCSLFRLDNTGKDVPESVHILADCDVGCGNLLQRSHELANGPPRPCTCPPDPEKEAELRWRTDPNGCFAASCWEGCWREASARYAEAKVPKWAYWAYIKERLCGPHGYEHPPVPWILDSIDIDDLEKTYAEQVERGLEYCDNWGAGECDPVPEDVKDPVAEAGADSDGAMPLPPVVPVPEDAGGLVR